MGIDAQQRPLFPPEADGATSAAQTVSRPLIDVVEQNHRLWVFKEKMVRWIKTPYDIHPGIDYPDSYQTADGRRRCLSWAFPETGLFRYEFYEFHNQKVQWEQSPLLTLRTLPQLTLAPDDSLFVCDPVVWGDPPEVIVIGWSGRLGKRISFDKSPEGLSSEAYPMVPERGFMARLSALTPDHWKVSSILIPYCIGAQLVVAPALDTVYMLGGKVAVPTDYQGQKLYFMNSNTAVWRLDGNDWQRIKIKEGVEPRNKATSQAAYDPQTRQLLTLTPRALYGFDSQAWHCLWQRGQGSWRALAGGSRPLCSPSLATDFGRLVHARAQPERLGVRAVGRRCAWPGASATMKRPRRQRSGWSRAVRSPTALKTCSPPVSPTRFFRWMRRAWPPSAWTCGAIAMRIGC